MARRDDSEGEKWVGGWRAEMTVGGRVMGADDSEGEKWTGKWGREMTVKGRSGWVGGGQR